MCEQHDKLHHNLNKEQLHVYNSVMDNIDNSKGGVYFVYGSGGCGKTFLSNTLCCKLRSEGKIVLHVESSGIAAMLLPGGRTSHSMFHIPLKLDQYSVDGIKHGIDLGELLKQTSLIIWDEAPMQHRYSFESVDRNMRDMSSVDPSKVGVPFGGITVVFGGDFRQILPVIPKASRAQVVGASLNSSKLWDYCKVYQLEKNMRLTSGRSAEERKEIEEFSKWVLSIVNGTLPSVQPNDANTDSDVVIPEKFLIKSVEKLIKDVVDVIYPDIVQNLKNPE
ncbi:uncharacterized protein LOC141719980 [Apium graveolens]|uniref:uncharacterized protein LOC141719980 n=1 Tax=Apium graveolens TaxID=4045 RepID=UPI003D7BD544